MAAPSGTVWGSVYGNYAKLGFYITHSSTSTSVTTTVQVWYWSKYGTADSVNTFYYDNLASAGSATTSKGAVSINTNVNSGSGWSTSNQSLLKTFTHTFNRTTSKQTRYIYAKLNTIETIEGQTVSGSTTYTVDPLPSYTITYNGNGGTVSPTSVTKYYNKNITLPSTATRTGYTFKGWATSASGSKAYDPGATYSGNANATLYAVWQVNTYTVSYNANGGSGAPGTQTKNYGDNNFKLSTTKPTRTNYTFKGWATSASGGVAYAAGGSYTANQSATLYAVWELTYEKPTIDITTVSRCDSAGTLTDSGQYVKVAFSWTTYYNSTTVKIEWKEAKTSVTTWSSSTQTVGAKSGTVNTIVGSNAISSEKNYVVRLTVGDSNGSTVITRNINSMSLPIDVLAGGTGVAIGKVAETADMLDVKYRAYFRNHVYMDKDYYICNLAANGSAGYWKFATLTPYSTYADSPIVFTIHQRGVDVGRLLVRYGGNSVITSHRLDEATLSGPISDVYYNHVGNGVYDLYLAKRQAWDAAGIIRLEMSDYQRTCVHVAWPKEHCTTLPSTATAVTRGSYFNEPIYMPNSTAIYMKNASGTYRNALHLNQSNQLNLGYGGYTAKEGETIIYGNKIQILSGSGASAVTFNKGLYSYGGFIELTGSTPFIDFHFGNSTADYTARIIERASGKLTVYNSISNASDRNLKKDIDDLPNDYLKVLKSLKPMQYRFIKGDDYLNVGFIAQDVEEAFVNAGFVDIPMVSADDDGTYTLDYNGFVAMLVQGYQQQQKEIDDLKQRLSALENLQNGEAEDNNNTEEQLECQTQ